MKEDWIRWVPVPGLKAFYYIDKLSNGPRGFEVELQAENDTDTVLIRFPNSVFAYRSTDETFRCLLVFDLFDRYGPDILGDGSLFRVENSHYLNWLSEQSATISDELGLVHYAIVGVDSVLDIVDYAQPEVTILSEGQVR